MMQKKLVKNIKNAIEKKIHLVHMRVLRSLVCEGARSVACSLGIVILVVGGGGEW